MICIFCFTLAPKRYTRANPYPNPPDIVDDLENFLRKTKNKNQSFTPIKLEKSPSLPKDGVLSIEDLYCDLKFEQTLFRTKSESDLTATVIDNSFLKTPEKTKEEEEILFDQEDINIFWDTLTTDLRQKLFDLDNLRFGLQEKLDDIERYKYSDLYTFLEKYKPEVVSQFKQSQPQT